MLIHSIFQIRENLIHNRDLHISGSLHKQKPDIAEEKPDVGKAKPDIERAKLDIDSMLNEKTKAFSAKTKANIQALFTVFGLHGIFGRCAVMETLDLKASAASDLIQRLLQADVIEPVYGYGKGKYRFKDA